jgi:hypothetical protein
LRNDHYFSFIGVGSDKNLKDIDVEKLFKEKFCIFYGKDK